MIITRRIAIRIGVLIIVSVVLQLSFFSYLSFFGTTPDVIPLVVISLGLLGGALVGAVCGFITGLLLDSALLATLGASSLALLAVGYLAGRYREGTEISNSLVPPLLIGALTMASAAAFAAIQLMLGIHHPVSLLVLREVILQGLLAGLLAIPFYPLIRRLLRPAIVTEAGSRPARSPIRAGASRPRRRRGRRVRRAAGMSQP